MYWMNKHVFLGQYPYLTEDDLDKMGLTEDSFGEYLTLWGEPQHRSLTDYQSKALYWFVNNSRAGRANGNHVYRAS